MNLVGNYSNHYYTGNTHLGAAHSQDYYSAQPNMGVSRYQWSANPGVADVAPPSHDVPWSTQPATHVTHHADNTPLTLALNNAEHYHTQYAIPAAPHGYTNVPMYDVMPDGTVKVRVVKRRNSANKKERRRTISINTAFASLRGCIPNVPSDTKLSKIKTLRLATSYIAYLMDILNKDDPTLTKGGFKAELSKKIEGRGERRKKEVEVGVMWGGANLFCRSVN